ncbi:16545_t:CDS:2, partial [Cetraspora pellucida]
EEVKEIQVVKEVEFVYENEDAIIREKIDAIIREKIDAIIQKNIMNEELESTDKEDINVTTEELDPQSSSD